MVLLSIGCSKDSTSIYENLSEVCNYFKDRNLNIAIYENNIGNMHYIKCIIRDIESDVLLFTQYRDTFYTYVANIIYNFISVEYIGDILYKIIKENYDYMEEEDLVCIKDKCREILIGTGIFSSEGMVYSMGCRNSIIRKIDEFLHESNEIILDGFIKFRLKDVNSSLKELADRVAEEYVLEKEYSEFIKLLKYFVEIQECKYENVNIYIDKNGEYSVDDGRNNDITEDFFQDFNVDCIKGDINKHDILISAIITSAPKRITVHGMENCKSVETIDTIKSIFGDAMKICNGCKLCDKLALSIHNDEK